MPSKTRLAPDPLAVSLNDGFIQDTTLAYRTMPPTTLTASREDTSPAARYAGKLLADLGVSANISVPGTLQHPAERWADCGLMHLTGDDEPEVCPVPLPDCADGALAAFRAVTGQHVPPGTTGSRLLTERAALMHLQRNGSQSPQGHCRLLPTADGCIGLNLAREQDWSLLPALFGREGSFDWQTISTEVAERQTGELLVRGQMLGLAVVDAGVIPATPGTWFRASDRCTGRSGGSKRPLVVDLSSLWAGPLCSHLWQLAGARVIKVESTSRPDGARVGSPAFFDLLNGDKESVTLDLHRESGRDGLRRLVLQADIVLEASRPRALRQMGIIAEDILTERPGLTWVGITGYGREEPGANWIAYGDDAGIAAGLSAILHQCTGRRLVCGDAIADPLTGLHAALAGWTCWQNGGGQLIDIALVDVVRHCIAATAPAGNDYSGRYRNWRKVLRDGNTPIRSPQQRGETHRHPD